MIVIISCLSAPLSAKELPVKIGRLTLSFRADQSFVPEAFRVRLSEDWKHFCADFASNFVVGKGPQGRGIASKTECQPLDFSGNEVIPTDNPWNVIFNWDAEGFSVTTYFGAKGAKGVKGKPNLIMKYVMPDKLTPDLLFSAQEPKFFLLSRIYRQLPVGWTAVFNKTDIEWQLTSLRPAMYAVMNPPRKIALFALAYHVEQKLWIPTLYAIAETIISDDSSKAFGRPGEGPLAVRWVKIPHVAKLRLWAQEIFDPLEPELDAYALGKRDSQERGILEGYALEALKSAVFSVRYGVPIPKGATVVSQASKIEGTVSVGRGFFEGFYFGFEHSPRIESKGDNETYSYTWTRMEAGWSFSLGEPQTIDRFATRFRLTPKIGMLSLDAYFPLAGADSEFATTAQFKLSRQLELGGEFSWELESLSYRTKIWVSNHLTGYVLAPKNPTKISNQRAGADFNYDVFKSRGGLRVGAVAFAYIDWVTLQAEVPSDINFTLVADKTASGASYSVSYFGLGLSLTW